MNKWDLTEINLGWLQEHRPEVAVLPIGAVEPHNLHLPEGQDLFHVTHVAKECCRIAWSKTESVICLPAIPYGVECNLMDFPLAIHVSQGTLDLMVRDIVTSLHHHGIRKIVIINGHGGNDFKPFIRQIQSDLDVHLFLCNWWTVGLDKYSEIFSKPDDHAGEMETSVALALHPNLVEIDRAKDGKAKPFRFDALNNGWLTTSRKFSRLNDHCACGDPSMATAEKGEAYLKLVIERISTFLIELAVSEVGDDFPH